ncbi:hypothetical protein [Streptomyces nigrescens]
MREQGKAVARCGRPLLFTAPIAGLVTLHPAAAHRTEARASVPDGALDPGTLCRAVLSVRTPALLVLLGTGLLTGYRETGLPAALRARPLRGPWPISAPPRTALLDRPSVLRV